MQSSSDSMYIDASQNLSEILKSQAISASKNAEGALPTGGVIQLSTNQNTANQVTLNLASSNPSSFMNEAAIRGKFSLNLIKCQNGNQDYSEAEVSEMKRLQARPLDVNQPGKLRSTND